MFIFAEKLNVDLLTIDILTIDILKMDKIYRPLSISLSSVSLS